MPMLYFKYGTIIPVVIEAPALQYLESQVAQNSILRYTKVTQNLKKVAPKSELLAFRVVFSCSSSKHRIGSPPWPWSSGQKPGQ